MPRYQCPECEAILKRAEAVPAGKKLKCPKCAFVFAPKALPEEPKEETIGLAGEPPPPPPKPAAKKVVYEDEDGPIGLAADPVDDKPKAPTAAQKKEEKAAEEEEDSKGQYGVLTEKKEEAAPEINFGSLRDKFAKSKVGPAMYLTVNASNWLLRLGIFSCICAIAKAFFDIFPLIFCEVSPIRPFIRPQITLLIFDFIVFCLGGVMCAGASRLHDLRSFTMAMIGSIMAIVIYMPICIMAAGFFILLFGPAGLMMAVAIGLISFVGVWCIIVMLKPAVREGFKERAEQQAG
ncbi:hypothetical protein [Zavarzinella formosa]|uniref:hypothetical protein n=1 Tax=Zavarzinella formosa TaxID=360055 RepID=UPI0002DD4604|nr:hypothetical protein [Zavarzinella formosa]